MYTRRADVHAQPYNKIMYNRYFIHNIIFLNHLVSCVIVSETMNAFDTTCYVYTIKIVPQ